MSALQLQDVWFSYTGQPVVSGATLWVEAGEMVALLGPTGPGRPR